MGRVDRHGRRHRDRNGFRRLRGVDVCIHGRDRTRRSIVRKIEVEVEVVVVVEAEIVHSFDRDLITTRVVGAQVAAKPRGRRSREDPRNEARRRHGRRRCVRRAHGHGRSRFAKVDLEVHSSKQSSLKGIEGRDGVLDVVVVDEGAVPQDLDALHHSILVELHCKLFFLNTLVHISHPQRVGWWVGDRRVFHRHLRRLVNLFIMGPCQSLVFFLFAA